MANFRAIQIHIDHGLNIAARKVGQPVNIYRLGYGAGTVNILDLGNLYVSRYCKFDKLGGSNKFVENRDLGSLIFQLIMDTHDLLPGDMIVQNDPFYDGNAIYTLASKRPIHRSVGVRCERLVQFYRPVSGSNNYREILSYSQQPPLILSNGQYSFGPVGSTPTLVPVGFQTQNRVYMDITSDIPSSTRITRWTNYIPLLPGVSIQEGDWAVEAIIDTATPGSLINQGDPNAGTAAADQIVRDQFGNVSGVTVRYVKYIVHLPFEQPVGLVGTQSVFEKIDLP